MAINDVDIDMITISNEFPSAKKVDYKNNEKTTPLCVFLFKMSGYIANFNDLKAICFLIEDEELLKKYNKI